MCRRNHKFLKQGCCQKISSGPKHCNPYPKTQWRFWKNNKRTSEHSPRLLGQTIAEATRQRKRQGWLTRMTDIQQMNMCPCWIYDVKSWLRLLRKTGNRLSSWSTLARFRVASNTNDNTNSQTKNIEDLGTKCVVGNSNRQSVNSFQFPPPVCKYNLAWAVFAVTGTSACWHFTSKLYRTRRYGGQWPPTSSTCRGLGGPLDPLPSGGTLF